MSTYQLPSNANKAEYVEQKFNEIAPKYDLFNDLITLGMHRYWKYYLVRKAGVLPDHVCVDLCCGSGDITYELSKVVTQGKVYGLDFSEGMLAMAQQRQKNVSCEPTWIQGDAMSLPFDDASVDTITIGYGFRNVTNLDTCLQEVLRVLKPGGVLASLDVGKVDIPGIDKCYDFFFFKVVPWIGKCLYPQQDMFDYLPHSSIGYPHQSVLKRQMLTSGFKQVDIHNFMLGASAIHIAYK